MKFRRQSINDALLRSLSKSIPSILLCIITIGMILLHQIATVQTQLEIIFFFAMEVSKQMVVAKSRKRRPFLPQAIISSSFKKLFFDQKKLIFEAISYNGKQ